MNAIASHGVRRWRSTACTPPGTKGEGGVVESPCHGKRVFTLGAYIVGGDTGQFEAFLDHGKWGLRRWCWWWCTGFVVVVVVVVVVVAQLN
ncbi:hypothetical protein K440DRAFT_628368, partial [Wilcoxina mikolae CBS 423.85]